MFNIIKIISNAFVLVVISNLIVSFIRQKKMKVACFIGILVMLILLHLMFLT